MAIKTKNKSATDGKPQTWKSIRVREPIHAQVVRFSKTHRLSIVDAYDVMVLAFSKLDPDEQAKHIQTSS